MVLVFKFHLYHYLVYRLSYDVASGSDIKIDNPLVRYVMTSIIAFSLKKVIIK